jgi:hypothetical protein
MCHTRYNAGMRLLPIKECVVEITVQATLASPHYKDSTAWLAQTDDDRRFEVSDREQATVFATPDAAIGAAGAYLVEVAMKWGGRGTIIPDVTYQVVRWRDSGRTTERT